MQFLGRQRGRRLEEPPHRPSTGLIIAGSADVSRKKSLRGARRTTGGHTSGESTPWAPVRRTGRRPRHPCPRRRSGSRKAAPFDPAQGTPSNVEGRRPTGARPAFARHRHARFAEASPELVEGLGRRGAPAARRDRTGNDGHPSTSLGMVLRDVEGPRPRRVRPTTPAARATCRRKPRTVRTPTPTIPRPCSGWPCASSKGHRAAQVVDPTRDDSAAGGAASGPTGGPVRGEDVVHQVRGAFRHAPPPVPRPRSGRP